MFVRASVRKSALGGPVALSLLKGVETWSLARNSAGIWLHVTSGIDEEKMQKLAGRIGYASVGSSFFKAIQSR